jgi:hypothetical protein
VVEVVDNGQKAVRALEEGDFMVGILYLNTYPG